MDQLVVEAVTLFPQDIPILERDGLRVSEWDARTMAAYGLTPIEALAKSMKGSTESVAVFVNEELVAVWGHGYRNLIAGIGYAWLITTPEAVRYKYRFARESRRLVAYLMTVYHRVEVFVDAEFLTSVEWLTRMGFAFHPVAIVENGHPFLFMWKERT